MAETKEEPIVDIQETVSKAERYIEENKKSLAIIFGAIVVIVAGYFLYKSWYIQPMEDEIRTKMFWAERYFEKDSFKLAVAGDGTNPGFEELVSDYGSAPSGNLCHYYLGVSYLHLGRYDEAISELEDFDAKDEYLGPVATADIGDCKMEQGKTEDAISYYIKAANMNKNDFSTPIFLLKAGKAYESLNNYAEALKVYEQIRTEHPDSREGKEIDKNIAYAKGKAGIQ